MTSRRSRPSSRARRTRYGRRSRSAVMSVRLESVSYTSGDGTTAIPSYLATPGADGPYPTVLILRGVAGPDDGYIEIAPATRRVGYVALLHGWKVRGNDPPDAPVYDDMKGASDLPPLGRWSRSEAVGGVRLLPRWHSRGHGRPGAPGDPRDRRLPRLRLPTAARPARRAAVRPGRGRGRARAGLARHGG